jgi:hypothetical protein
VGENLPDGISEKGKLGTEKLLLLSCKAQLLYAKPFMFCDEPELGYAKAKEGNGKLELGSDKAIWFIG